MDLATRRRYKALRIKALMAMAGSPSQPPTLEELAERYQCDPVMLAEIIASSAVSTEASPPPVKDPRITLATQLLRNTEMGVFSIGEHIGFRTVRAFCDAFQSQRGVSPQRYREMYLAGRERRARRHAREGFLSEEQDTPADEDDEVTARP